MGDELVINSQADARAGDDVSEPWTQEQAARLAQDFYTGRPAACPRCGGWVQGTAMMGAPTLRKPVLLECGDCGRSGEAYAITDNEGRRVPEEDGGRLEHARKNGAALVCPFCGTSMRLLRDVHPSGGEIFAYDCPACGASHYETGGVL